jgi:NAD(P)-dependent dehydrogenase (short-subunit alcohol dehydrogenase family)
MTSAQKVAIVTGARQGIGRRVAVELAVRGFAVVVAARGDAAETVDEVESVGGRALLVRGDLASASGCAALVEAAVDRFGRLDVVVNNAAYTTGPSMFASVDELSLDEWRKQFDINVHAPLALTQAAVPFMRRVGGGVVINITSPAGVPRSVVKGVADAPFGIMLGYDTTKAALDRMTNSLANALVGEHIAVLAYDPGFVATETMVTTMEHLGAEAVEAADPRDTARAIVDLVAVAWDKTGEVVRAYG